MRPLGRGTLEIAYTVADTGCPMLFADAPLLSCITS